METVCQLDKHNPQVFCHRNQQFTQVLCLMFSMDAAFYTGGRRLA